MNLKLKKKMPLRQVLLTRKKHRNRLKSVDPLARCERTPIEFIPLEVSARVLSNPKQRLTAKSRKRFLRSRANTIAAPTNPAVASPIKFAKRLSRLSLFQLGRERKKAARRAATAKHLLDKLSPNSPFRPPVASEQSKQIYRLAQVMAEIGSRIKST